MLQWLLRTLWEHSWSFLILHAVVLFFLILDLRRIKTEARACEDWPTKPTDDENLTIVHQLQLFQQESDRWRTRGVVLPMTDFSDRIDSIIEGLADQVHNRVNLFLVVGIAGTFYGMTSFGRELIQSTQAGAFQTENVYRGLVQGIAYSFPVGFLGLILALFWHPTVSHFEQGLRNAAREAVNRAMLSRTLALQVSSDELYLNMLRESLAGIRELLENNRKQLDENSKAFSTETKTIAESMDGLRGGITALRQPIQDLTKRLGRTAEVVESIAAIAQQASEHSTHAKELLIQLQREIATTVTKFDETADKFGQLPTVVTSGIDRSFQQITTSATETISSATERLYGSLAGAVTTAAGELQEQSRKTGEELVAASRALGEVSATFAPTLREAFTESAATLRQPLADFQREFAEHYPESIRELRKTLDENLEKLSQGRAMLEAIGTASGRAGQTVQAWANLERVLSSSEASLRNTANELNKTAQVLQQTQRELLKRRRGLFGFFRGAEGHDGS